ADGDLVAAIDHAPRGPDELEQPRPLTPLVDALEVRPDLHALAERVARHAARGEDLLRFRCVRARAAGGKPTADEGCSDHRHAQRAGSSEKPTEHHDEAPPS